MVQSSVSLVRPTLTLFILAVTVVALLFLRSEGDALVKDTFELDANSCAGVGCTVNEAKAAYYAGIEDGEDDWATSSAIPGPNSTNDGLADCQAAGAGAQPVFLSCNSDRTDLPTCYNSRVDTNPAIVGSAVFICDGNSGGTLQGETDIVSSFSGCSDQKTNDNRWCVKKTGVLNNPAKSDETHGYTLINRPVVCNSGPDAGETHNFILGGYERLGNEGTVFAGFVFAQEAPLTIPFGSDATLNFVDPADSTIHYRNVGDILVLLNQAGNNVTMQFSVAVDHDSNPATVPIYPAPTTATAGTGNCGSTAVINPKLSGADADNVGVLSPPWLGEFCDDVVDPTGDDTNDLVGTTNNQCKIIGNVPPGACNNVADASSQAPPCQPGGNLVPPSDFVEFALDLTGLNLDVDPCALQTVLMTSRSSDEFTADLKDVAQGQIPPTCEITVDKTGDTLSKIGDPVDYTITISNTKSTPLYKDDITDTLLGDIVLDGVDQVNPYITSNNCNDAGKNPLQPGDSCTITATRTVQQGDPDPLPNTVTAVYNSKSDFSGAAITDSDDHSVNLFQPGITIDKTGDSLSKVGDSVNYQITVTNTSSADSPNCVGTVTDPLLGINQAINVAPGSNVFISKSRTVLAGDPDPVVNTATVTCSPAGFPNVLTASDGHSVDLFQPCVSVDKTGDTLSKIGDDVNYNVTVTNCSSADSPNLILDSIIDSLKNLSGLIPAACNSLAPAASCNFSYTRTVLAGDPDPVVNTVTVHYHPAGFPNDITASDGHSVNLFQPAVDVDKTGDTLSKVGDEVDYAITLSNNSSADTPALTCTASDSLLGVVFGPAALPLGDTVLTPSRTVLAGDPDPLLNTVTLTCSPAGFPNVLQASDGHSVNLFQPGVDVEKVCDDFAKFPAPGVGSPNTDAENLNDSDDIRCTISITNLSSADSPDLVNGTVQDTLCGNLLGALNAECTPVSNTCSSTLPTGGSCEIVYDFGGEFVASTPDPIVNTVIVHYNPERFPNDITDSDTETIDVLHPNYTLTKDCLTETVPPGGSAIFKVVFANTGDTVLTVTADEDMEDVSLVNNIGSVPTGTPFTLGVGVTKTFEITLVAGQGPIIENTVNADATLPVNTGLTNVLERSATDHCDVQGGATRTPGFWQTHLDYTCHVFEDHLGGSINLGWKTLTSCEQVFGMFWANNAWDSDGDRRGRLCQARVIGSFQLLAAILNTGLDNGAVVPIDPVTGLDIITAMQNALAGNNIKEIKRIQGLLDAYNNSGDDVAIIDNDGTLAGKADPNGAKEIADYTIADC